MRSIDIHPVIRIVTFLVLGAYLAVGRPLDLAVIASLLVLLYMTLEKARPAAALLAMRRLRWFFLSILIVYFWFTPGAPVWSGVDGAYAAWLPTVDGVQLGLVRAAALALFVLGVTLLLQTTSRNELITGIRALVRPVPVSGRFHDRLALRIALVLETVPKIQPLVRSAVPRRNRYSRPLNGVGTTAARLAALARDQAGQAPCEPIELPPDTRPPVNQWLWPITLAITLWVIG